MRSRGRTRTARFVAVAVAVNIAAIAGICLCEKAAIDAVFLSETQAVERSLHEKMGDYAHSFGIFSEMMAREVERQPDPDSVERFLKDIDGPLMELEGDTFDGLYMYYQGRYLYSWDTPHAVYEESGYQATERPWYRNAVAAQGDLVLTPPYMSYANHYILSTISQLQPDGQTVFAYDIKMGDIQDIAAFSDRLANGTVLVYDAEGTVVGSTDGSFLGNSLHASVEEAATAAAAARKRAGSADLATDEERQKAQEEAEAAEAFALTWRRFASEFAALDRTRDSAAVVVLDGEYRFGYVHDDGQYGVLALASVPDMLATTAGAWLVPLLLVELLLVYVLMRISKGQRTRELRAAYVELGQMQSRLEIALAAAKKDAAIDDLTGIMNARSFKQEVTSLLERMSDDDCGLFIMLDGDRFKEVNDTFGHDMGDEAIKLAARMIVGRVRTVDLAARLHGDEFAIFVWGTKDAGVAKSMVEDVNATMRKEALRRGIPPISLSAGAVAAASGDAYTELSKKADEALYRAKRNREGGFESWEPQE